MNRFWDALADFSLRRPGVVAGAAAVGELGITTIGDALHLQITDVTPLGTGPDTNVRLTMRPIQAEPDRLHRNEETP